MKKFFATCPKGLEYLLRDELIALGASDVHEALSGVHFSGELIDAYRACLWSRLASRVLMPLSEFAAADEHALYDGVQAIDWSQHLTEEGTLAVDAVSNASLLRHTRYLAQKVKDAVVDQFRDRNGNRPGVDLEQPSIRLNLLLRKDRALLSLDLSGTPLHRRGYRVGQGEAPLKENLACAMLLRAGWPEIFKAGGAIVDPMCGSGTLVIEAALMAADVAPGIRRMYFGFLGWLGHDAVAWEALIAEANARSEAGLRALPAAFFGDDEDPNVLNQAKRNAQQAGVIGFARFDRQSVEHLQRPTDATAPGLLICNPPYGERIGQQAALVPTYRSIGDKARAEFDGWRLAVITSDEDLGRAIGLRAHKRYVLYNGALECRLLLFEIGGKAAPQPVVEKPLTEGAEAVANRLRKNIKHLRKRLDREGVHCWRAYDADIPEYSAAIDVYVGREESRPDRAPSSWLHVQEYAAPKDIPEHVASARLAELVRGAGEAFELPRERIAVKTRYKARGGGKYGRMDQRSSFVIVEEGGLKFRVNLYDYLDTGLFLDHRPVRSRLREAARGTRFLNLFCYTATASVYAASGGARTTTSVDLSATYLDWAASNLALNGFSGEQHQLVQADCLQWLAHDRGEYDLIFVDPPTFSNSKRAEDFDVQKEHVRLLQLCAERLAFGGMIVFSNNFRRFKLDPLVAEQFAVRDISSASIPFDFTRNSRIHQCYELQPI
ncbi:MAG TPA: bifunctional 23S rRNA (guanine(2069)-N(7))-methyltransferase RlmK/23S rRNA (guanine(2445)-N(2))-methyltransferase RlmL [Dokdonella sp.]|uniref:bifunctional 23S rRNA (guanine(2069)-N(7))-methyltransferase RlmK/23S rRNA (guanine(2445)-N(2))-methyltransferase RlmL n=1 Tax=Dokdonella sp. TaxID=2291710 RepID=UPI002D7F60D4|nr:bifunctional 23S rRNA (guanine(2069)-N(7))-methyltransferase RlmK/23S rRNA (guanine(2445)-N(2))-methyltransferase RlmL [Dokdonella sp.]HET9034039.1 bifunctional 23S rRNA (guanine(2069)-N(7))-methyltransferase RlmK/23S rRNA (guanine(2445)-N(2))-methyltransferase RlmL [Dokdonella sp.]